MRDQSRGSNGKCWVCMRLQTGKAVVRSEAEGTVVVWTEAFRMKQLNHSDQRVGTTQRFLGVGGGGSKTGLVE